MTRYFFRVVNFCPVREQRPTRGEEKRTVCRRLEVIGTIEEAGVATALSRRLSGSVYWINNFTHYNYTVVSVTLRWQIKETAIHQC